MREGNKKPPQWAAYERRKMVSIAEVGWVRAWFWVVGTKCFALGCYAFPRLRPVLWLLGRCFVRWSGIRWEDICLPVDDEVNDGLNDQLGRSAARQGVSTDGIAAPAAKAAQDRL